MRGRCRLTYKIVGKNEGGRKGGKQKGECMYIKNNVCGGGRRDEKER